MEIFLTFCLFALGLLFIIKGGDWFVDAASWIAEISGIPKFLIGATIVSLATTLPELLVSIFAALDGKVDIAVGNAVGSVTANTGLIMAISIICIPAVIERSKFSFKALLMLGSSVALWLLSFRYELTIVSSVFLIAVFIVFIIDNVLQAKKSFNDDTDNGIDFEGNPEEKKPRPEKKEIFTNLLKFIIGIVGIVYGADLLVEKGSEIARMLHVSEAIIGVTIIAIGTSLPELVTTITAIIKKESALSIGNILGANIIDLTFIMPMCALVSGKALPVARQSALLDMPVCSLIIMIAVVPTLIFGKFKRWQGILMGVLYTAYLVLTCTVFFQFN